LKRGEREMIGVNKSKGGGEERGRWKERVEGRWRKIRDVEGKEEE
jgi:hypothetical protein